MASAIRTITIDCHDPYLLAQFWQQALDGYAEDPDDPNQPGDPAGFLRGPVGAPNLLFVPVPEWKVVKNRVHIDVAPVDVKRDEEVYRLMRLGATLIRLAVASAHARGARLFLAHVQAQNRPIRRASCRWRRVPAHCR